MGGCRRPLCALVLFLSTQSFARLTTIVDSSSSGEYLEATAYLTRLPGPILAAQGRALREAFAEMLGVSQSQVRIDDASASARLGLEPNILRAKTRVDFTITVMLSLPDTFAAFKLQKKVMKGEYAKQFNCKGYELTGVKWLQLHGKPEMLTYAFIHVIMENRHSAEVSDAEVERLKGALGMYGHIPNFQDDISVVAKIQAAKHLDIEFKIEARSSKIDDTLMKVLKSGRLLSDVKNYLVSSNSELKLLQIEKPSVGFHILRATAGHKRTRRSHAGILVSFHCLVPDTDASHFKRHDGEVVLIYAAAATANLPARRFGIGAIDEQLAQLDVLVSMRMKTSVEAARLVGIINRGKFLLNQSHSLSQITTQPIHCRDAEISTLQTASSEQFSSAGLAGTGSQTAKRMRKSKKKAESEAEEIKGDVVIVIEDTTIFVCFFGFLFAGFLFMSYKFPDHVRDCIMGDWTRNRSWTPANAVVVDDVGGFTDHMSQSQMQHLMGDHSPLKGQGDRSLEATEADKGEYSTQIEMRAGQNSASVYGSAQRGARQSSQMVRRSTVGGAQGRPSI
jgi:hypothetical protein